MANKALMMIGREGAGKSRMAVEVAGKLGQHVTIGFDRFMASYRPYLATSPAVVIVEETPRFKEWPKTIANDLKRMLSSETTTCKLPGAPMLEVPVPHFIFVMSANVGLPSNMRAVLKLFKVVHVGARHDG